MTVYDRTAQTGEGPVLTFSGLQFFDSYILVAHTISLLILLSYYASIAFVHVTCYHCIVLILVIIMYFYSQIYYDSDFKLVRYDLVNTQPSPPLFTSDPISAIHDYTSGE